MPRPPAELALTRIEYYAACALTGYTSRQHPLPASREIVQWCWNIAEYMAAEGKIRRPAG